MIFKRIALALVVSFAAAQAIADTASETVTETTTEIEKKDVKVFCSKKDENDAATQCQKWLEAQKISLGARVLTSHCGNGNIGDQDCLFKATGEITFLLKETKKETKR